MRTPNRKEYRHFLSEREATSPQTRMCLAPKENPAAGVGFCITAAQNSSTILNPNNTRRGDRSMKTAVYMIASLSMQLGLVSCGKVDPEGPELRMDENSLKALEWINNNDEYATIVAEGARNGVFAGLGEQRAFETTMEHDSHNLYTAFLKIYPESPHRVLVEDKISEFRVFFAEETQIITTDLHAAMCWPTSGRTYKWGPGPAGFNTATGFRFGPLMMASEMGTIQLIQGGYRAVAEGTEFQASTMVLYQTKCH